jgi:hypothetical protein
MGEEIIVQALAFALKISYLCGSVKACYITAPLPAQVCLPKTRLTIMFGRPEVSTKRLFVEIASLMTLLFVLSALVLR